jgi:hypothetical protein
MIPVNCFNLLGTFCNSAEVALLEIGALECCCFACPLVVLQNAFSARWCDFGAVGGGMFVTVAHKASPNFSIDVNWHYLDSLFTCVKFCSKDCFFSCFV